MNLYSQGGDVFLFEFSSEMALDEGGLGILISRVLMHQGWQRTFPVPPSPTNTNLNTGDGCSAMMRSYRTVWVQNGQCLSWNGCGKAIRMKFDDGEILTEGDNKTEIIVVKKRRGVLLW